MKMLRNSALVAAISLAALSATPALAQKNKGDDAYGYRSEFIQLLRQAEVSEKI